MQNRNLLDTLLQRSDVWQASRTAHEAQASLPTGQSALDRALHYGGWPNSAITEILSDFHGCGELSLLLPGLAQCSQDSRWLLLIAPPYLPYAPALQAAGLPLERLLVAAPGNVSDLFWCAEQSLRSGACSALLAWLPNTGTDYHKLRRLQLAAKTSKGPVFFFRSTEAAHLLSPAALRLRLSADTQVLGIEILKQRGGAAGQRLRLPHPARLMASPPIAKDLPIPALQRLQSAPHATTLLTASCSGLVSIFPNSGWNA